MRGRIGQVVAPLLTFQRVANKSVLESNTVASGHLVNSNLEAEGN